MEAADEPLDLSVKSSVAQDPEFEEAFDDAEHNLVAMFHSKLLPIKKRNVTRPRSVGSLLHLPPRFSGQSRCS